MCSKYVGLKVKKTI